MAFRSPSGPIFAHGLPGGRAHHRGDVTVGYFPPSILCPGSMATLPVFSLDAGGSGSDAPALKWPTVVSDGGSSGRPATEHGALASLPGLGSVPPRLVKKILKTGMAATNI